MERLERAAGRPLCQRAERRVHAPTPAARGRSAGVPSIFESTRRYLPALLRAAGLTLVLSCLAMALAVAVGMGIAIGRVYGDPLTRTMLTVYVEVMRGTPVLLQLFVIYYGLSAVVRLPAFVAALIGLGLNYAAYESEIYRSALQAVPRGQIEAARILGFTEVQILRLVRGPQAFRLALAPMTNDFVALLKDSSLVSVITVVELTKQTQIFATNIGSWLVPGLLCAAMYLAMSLPLARAGAHARGAMAGAIRMTAVSRCPRAAAVARDARDSARCRYRRERAARSSRSWACPAPGKTTILRSIAGLESFDAGEIRVDTATLPPQSDLRHARRALHQKVGMVFQFHFLFEHLSAIDNVCLAPVHVQRTPKPTVVARARSLLDHLGVGHRADGVSARVVGWRGAARGDRSRAGRRSAAAPARRADRIARSGALRRARPHAAATGGAKAARS